jgi:hypothetical protein
MMEFMAGLLVLPYPTSSYIENLCFVIIYYFYLSHKLGFLNCLRSVTICHFIYI